MGIFLTVLPLAVGGTAAVLTMDAMAQYSALPQPPLAPPAWVFPAVWTVLYLLMGAASRRVYRLGTQESRNALMLYYVQLAAHFVWPLLETGRNSVMPCTMPSRIACSVSIYFLERVLSCRLFRSAGRCRAGLPAGTAFRNGPGITCNVA